MSDNIFKHLPAIHKWDTFWVGLLLAMVVPVISFFLFFLFTYVSSVYVQHMAYSFRLFYMSATISGTFLKTSTLCCLPNGAIFFWLMQRNYINAARAVMITTMVFIIAIVIKQML